MAEDAAFAAVDLGAESGRVMVGRLRDGRVGLEQLHRFGNVPIRTPDGLHWNVWQLYAEVIGGLRAAARAHGDAIVGVGVDSWAVDYGLLDGGGRLLGTPYHYRDSRTDGVREEVERLVPAGEQYARTGIAQLPFNTLYQLVAQRRVGDGTLDLARSLLMVPDLLHYWLAGEIAAEYTNASTTGLFGVDGYWAADLLGRLGVPARILLTPALPGTILGGVRREVREATGLHRARVILPATHDTACAVAAVPFPLRRPGASRAFISAGTWSLLGLELDHPVLGEEARRTGFTNEGGVEGTYRFLINITGLWLLQECRRAWARQGQEWSYEELTARAAAEAAPGVIIDVNDPAFLHPEDMPEAIAAHLRRTGQPVPAEPAGLVRAVLEGVALAYRVGLERAERLAGTQVEAVHLVGGGVHNALLCQLAADACRRPVFAGPVEATALGNVLVQAMGMGLVRDLAEARAAVRASFQVAEYEPAEAADWDERAARLEALQASRAAAATT